MLSKPYRDIKHLRSRGKAAEALAQLRSAPPTSDEDAFEAAICLMVCGDIASAVHVCESRNWKVPWARHSSKALIAFLRDGEPARALKPAQQAIGSSAAGYDAQAVYLMLLQANGMSAQADAYMRQHLSQPPPAETLLLTIMAEVAAAVSDWKQAYSFASAVVAADPEDFRALITLSVVNHSVSHFHESLGNALRARLVNPQSQQAALQIMRGYNSLGDHYAAIGAFNWLENTEQLAAGLYVELGNAYAGLGLKAEAIAALHTALRDGPQLEALNTLITIHAEANEREQVQALVERYAHDMKDDIRCQLALALERLQHGELELATQGLETSFALSRKHNLALNGLPTPIPEPRVRHDYEQLELLARRGKLDAAGRDALNLLKRYYDPASDTARTFAPAGKEAALLENALTDFHYRPDARFSGRTLGDNDYRDIETRYFASTPALVVIDNFLSPQALAALRHYCEEATVWKMSYQQGYVGAILAQGFDPEVLLAAAHELKQAMPRVIGDQALTQAWAFKYDQRMQGINMHADFAKVNVNFWITPNQSCMDHSTGGMVIYDVPAPPSWTFFDYNTNQSKMKAYLKVNNAKSSRVPYRENRCVLFDSSLIHVTDELHFRPGYENRRVNVTLLYGRARAQG